jgi:tRNA A-37 threonylcarbamoyl transferase component Bud32
MIDIDSIISKNLNLLSKQGNCNRVYKLHQNNQIYLYRELLRDDRDRELEWNIHQKAYDLAISSKPIVYDREQGVMISSFIQAKHKGTLTLDEVVVLAWTLKKFHSIEIKSKFFEIDIKKQTLQIKEAIQLVQKYPKEYVTSHNDLTTNNLLFSDDKIYLIDFEYAQSNDRYFDLASLCVEFSLDEVQTKLLMDSYFESGLYHIEKLKAYQVIYKAISDEWFEENLY